MNRTLVLLIATALAACGDSPTTPDSGRQDGGGSTDGGSLDAGTMADGGRPSDAGEDDAGSADAGSPRCDPGEYEGDSTWGNTLVVEAGDRLCAYAPDTMALDHNGLDRVIRNKSVIHPIAGTYAIPDTAGDQRWRIPACVDDGDGSTPLGAATSATIGGSFLGPLGTGVTGDFDLDGESVSITFFQAEGAETFPFIADTDASDREAHMLSTTGSRGMDANARYYASCSLPINTCTRLTAEGTDLRVDEYTWAGSPGRGFSTGIRLSGTFDGETRRIEGYENVSTVYSRHSFSRRHFFRFPEPTAEGHCGLVVDVGDFVGRPFVAYGDCEGQIRGSQLNLTEAAVDCE